MLLRTLDEALRRPGEVFTDEWDGYRPRHSGFPMNIAWLQDLRDEALNESLEMEDATLQAWDELCDDPAFESWLATPAHRELTSTQNFLNVDERDDQQLRVTHKGNLYVYVPMADVRSSDSRVGFFKAIIIKVLARRASDAGMPPPPPI